MTSDKIMKPENRIKGIFLIGCIIILFSACSSKSPREMIDLNGEWIFAIDSTGRGIAQEWTTKGIDKHEGTKVMVPHTWNTIPSLTRYWGKAWYEKEIFIPSEWQNQAVKLQFDAVYHDAIIWINGKFAGQHIGSGYNRFYITADSLIHPGALNRITLLADNSSSKNNLPYEKSFDWGNDGGITRKVCLIKTGFKAIQNIHVSAIPIDIKRGEGRATIAIDLTKGVVYVSSETEIEAVLKEYNQKSSKVIWKGKLKGIIEEDRFHSTLNFLNLKFWHFDEPNLYKLKISLKIKGKLEDETETTFGFRTMKTSASNFVLNGEPARIGGVEWMPGSNLQYGMAEPESEMSRNLVLMKRVNAVFTRFHWEQDEYIIDWCDRNGIMIQEELPAWGWGPKWNDSLYNIAKEQLYEIISTHYNHPSIISWGIGNELTSHDSLTLRYLKGLYNYCRSLDTTRLINYVSNQLNTPLKGKKKVLPDASNIGDVLMFNEYYSTWYNQSTDSISGALDRIHADYPGKALVISEFGICEPVFKGGDARRSKEMKEQFRIYGEKPYVAGAIYFCLNDYRTHMGEDFTYSYPQRVHGISDIHSNLKPSYKELKSILSPLEIVSIKKKTGVARVLLKCKRGIPSYTVKNYVIKTSKKKFLTGEMNPGDKRQFELPYDLKFDTLQIIRPTRFEVLSVPL